MQAENRTQAQGPRDLDIWTTQGETQTKDAGVRDQRNQRMKHTRDWVDRFGPMPGEIYPDEAHFGSFS